MTDCIGTTVLTAVLKISIYGPELIWHFGKKLAKNTQLSFSDPNIKAQRSKEYINFNKMIINF